MSLINRSELRNRLLAALPDAEFQAMQSHLEHVALPLRTSLAEPGIGIAYVHFIETGIASVVAVGTDGERIEVGHVGWEGMTGTAVCLGADVSDTHTFMQAEGTATRIAATDFAGIFHARPVVRSLVLRYVHTQQVQVASTVLANARYGLRACLARWILMANDRIANGPSTIHEVLPLTHEFLSLMLGVRRAGVTEAMGLLEKAGLVEARRGKVRILDRQRLVEAAGPAYGQPELVYDRLIR